MAAARIVFAAFDCGGDLGTIALDASGEVGGGGALLIRDYHIISIPPSPDLTMSGQCHRAFHLVGQLLTNTIWLAALEHRDNFGGTCRSFGQLKIKLADLNSQYGMFNRFPLLSIC